VGNIFIVKNAKFKHLEGQASKRNLNIELRKSGEHAFKDLKEKIAKMGKKELTCVISGI
jgi:hypothetical protein